jgi:hypothetical protein
MRTWHDMKPFPGILLATILAVASHPLASQVTTNTTANGSNSSSTTTTLVSGSGTTTGTTTGTTQEPTIRFSNAVRYYQPSDEVFISFGANTVMVEEQLNYVGYIPGESLRIALAYNGVCPVAFKSLTDTGIYTFRPRRVTGVISDADGSNIGTVIFFVRFDTMNGGGSRSYAMATLQLNLEVDHDCDQGTPSLPLNVGVSVAVSTKTFD